MSVNRAIAVLNLCFKNLANLKQSEIYRRRLHRAQNEKTNTAAKFSYGKPNFLWTMETLKIAGSLGGGKIFVCTVN